jgi:hypothetical protein
VSHVVEAGAGQRGGCADATAAAPQVVGLHQGADPGRKDEPVLLSVRPGVGPLGELLAAVLTKRVDAQPGSGTVRAEPLVLGRTKRNAPPTAEASGSRQAQLGHERRRWKRVQYRPLAIIDGSIGTLHSRCPRCAFEA